MVGKASPPPPPGAPGAVVETARGETRQDRQAAALRANLRRRKAQKRGRDDAQTDAAGPENSAPEGAQNG